MDEREALQEKIQACSKSEEDLQREIQKKKEKLEQLTREIKEKTEHIKREVRTTVSEARKNIEDVVEEQYRRIVEELADLETEFDLELVDFEGMVIGIYDKLLRGWDKVTYQLEQNLYTLIEENIDDEVQIKKISEPMMRILRRALDIEIKEVGSVKIDFKELEELDRELLNNKDEYMTMREKLRACRGDYLRYETLKNEKEALERKIERLEEQRENRMEIIGDPLPQEKQRSVEKKREREGFFGKIGNVLFGPKIVNTNERYTDYSQVEEAKKRKEALKQEYSVTISMKEEALLEKLQKVEQYGDIENNIMDVKFEVEDTRKKYEANQKKLEQEKESRINKIVRVSNKNYLDGVKNICDEYINHTRNFLEDQKRLISKIMEEALRDEKRKVDFMQENLYNLADLGGQTPEELQNQIKKFYDQLEYIKAHISQIQGVKESI